MNQEIKDIAANFHKTACGIAENEQAASIVFFVKTEGEKKAIAAVPLAKYINASKDITAAFIKHATHTHKEIEAVIFVTEAWFYAPKGGKNDHTARQIMEGEMNVSDLKGDDKREAIVTFVETREGDSLTLRSEITRIADSVIVEDAEEFDFDTKGLKQEGRFTHFFGGEDHE